MFALGSAELRACWSQWLLRHSGSLCILTSRARPPAPPRPAPADYEADMGFLGSCTQDELVQLLRSDGRRQAAQRMLKQKRDGAALYHGESDED